MVRRRRPPRAGAVSELPPLKILLQILSLQLLFYSSLAILYSFACITAGWQFNWNIVFGWEGIRGDTTRGWLFGFILVLTGSFVCGLIGMVLIVKRSKLVIDFSLSMHLIHFVVCYFYTGVAPQNRAWWVVMMASSGMAIVLGVWGCRWRELRPISFGGREGGAASSASAQTRSNSTGLNDIVSGHGPDRENEDSRMMQDGTQNDLEHGLARGRGRGRGRDGAGDYEMVKISKERRED